MRFFIFLFLASIGVSAQQKALELKIDSITFSDSIPDEREFTINYHLENKTGKAISFFLDTNSIIPNSSGSMRYEPTYKTYQENEFLNIANLEQVTKKRIEITVDYEKGLHSTDKTIRDETLKRYFREQYGAEYDSIVADMKDKSNDNFYELLEKRSKNLIRSICTLQPKESKQVTLKMTWDKKRAYSHDDHDFYIDEKAKHTFEISINLMKEEFKNRMTEAEFQKIKDDPNFIKGVFVSNRFPINFAE
jgi:hypothetical protein